MNQRQSKNLRGRHESKDEKQFKKCGVQEKKEIRQGNETGKNIEEKKFLKNEPE